MHMVKVGTHHINLDAVAYVHDNRGQTSSAVAGVWLEFNASGAEDPLCLRVQDEEAALLVAYLDRQSVDLAEYANEEAERAARAQAEASASYRALGEIPF